MRTFWNLFPSHTCTKTPGSPWLVPIIGTFAVDGGPTSCFVTEPTRDNSCLPCQSKCSSQARCRPHLCAMGILLECEDVIVAAVRRSASAAAMQLPSGSTAASNERRAAKVSLLSLSLGGKRPVFQVKRFKTCLRVCDVVRQHGPRPRPPRPRLRPRPRQLLRQQPAAAAATAAAAAVAAAVAAAAAAEATMLRR